jgi:hypothetical protein
MLRKAPHREGRGPQRVVPTTATTAAARLHLRSAALQSCGGHGCRRSPEQIAGLPWLGRVATLVHERAREQAALRCYVDEAELRSSP